MNGDRDPRTSYPHDTPAGTAHGPTPSGPGRPNPSAVSTESDGRHRPGLTAEMLFQGAGVAGSVIDSQEPPAVSGRYRVESLHRSGGLGRVWLAKDNTIGRNVALKDIRPDRASDPQLRARFVEEARITGQLEHPCIVPLYDLIEGPEGPCYTMPFVAGQTLAEAARAYHDKRAAGRADPLALTGLLDALVAVCRAVAYAHSRGVLHRDIKGQNVKLGDFGEVFVLDWGLAKLSSDPMTVLGPAAVTPVPDGSREETVTGALMGTPVFMAPEQVNEQPASRASDVYSLGGLLYVILTGQPPYDGPSRQSVLEQLQAGPPSPPRALVPSCPPALDAICRKAMARDPNERYASAEALAADVRRWLADEPVSAYSERLPARLLRWGRRHRAAVFGGLAVLMTAVIGLVVTLALVWREQLRTAAERDRAEQRLVLARGLSDSLLDLSERYLAPATAAEDTRRAVVDKALTAARQTLEQQPDDAATQQWAAKLFRYSANIHRLIDDTVGAAPSYAEAVRLYEALSARSPGDLRTRNLLAETLRDQAYLRTRLGDYGKAAAGLARSIELASTLRDSQPDDANYVRTLATALLDSSGVAADRGRFGQAEDEAARAADLFQELLKAPKSQSHRYDRTFLATAWSRQAVARRERGQTEAALAAHVTAFKEFQVIMANKDKTDLHFYCRALVERARTYAGLPNQRERNRAERDFTQAIDIWADLQKRSPRTGFYREGQAVAYAGRAQLSADTEGTKAKAAPDDLERSRALLNDLVGENPAVASYHANLGRTYAALGRLAAAGGDTAGAVNWFTKAATSFRAALARAPEADSVRRELDQIEAGRGK